MSLIDVHEFELRPLPGSAQGEPTDATKAIDANANGNCHTRQDSVVDPSSGEVSRKAVVKGWCSEARVEWALRR